MPLVSKAEYSRRKGWSHQHTSKLEKSGKIKTVNGKVDVEKSNAMLDAESDPARDEFRKEGGGNGFDDGFRKARTVKEHYNARLAQLEFERESGKLINAKDEREYWFNVIRQVRDALLNIPARLSGKLAATFKQKENKRTHAIVEIEINLILEDLAKNANRRTR